MSARGAKATAAAAAAAALPSPTAGVQTSGRWLASPYGPLAGWLSAPDGCASQSGVLVLPPIGYPYWSSHHTLRVLAERLAGAGHLVLRCDYASTGDSAGGQWEPARIDAWRASVQAAGASLRELGCTQLTLIGVGLGGTFALQQGEGLGAGGIAAWAPVVSGRRYVKELRLLSLQVPGDSGVSGGAGSLVFAGTVFGTDTLNELGTIDLAALSDAPAGRVLVVDTVADEALVARLRTLGSAVEERALPGGESALEVPSEDATVPEAIVDAIVQWSGSEVPLARSPAPGATITTIDWGGSWLSEEIVELGPHALTGILTSPQAPGEPTRATVVFLNTGSEPHVGPGRAWVELARELALRGHSCLRVDFRGFGESPDGGYAPGRPYDAHGEDDTREVVHALRSLGHRRIVLVGLCASAWIALRAVLREPVDGVIALNPQLYWATGDPVKATMRETRADRTALRKREALGGRVGLWTLLDVAGHRPRVARWLDRLAAGATPVVMVFAEGDDGIEYLRNRLRRRLGRLCRGGGITVVEVPDIDHSMHRAWRRGAMVDVLDAQLAAFDEQWGSLMLTASASDTHRRT